jgi:plasmid maintenance system antidote protein VapI
VVQLSIDISIKELSRKTGIPFETVRTNMNATRKITLENGLKIAEALGITPKKLWEMINNETSKK